MWGRRRRTERVEWRLEKDGNRRIGDARRGG